MPSNTSFKDLKYPDPSTSCEVEGVFYPQPAKDTSIRLPFPLISLRGFPPTYERRRAYHASEHPLEIQQRREGGGGRAPWGLYRALALPAVVLGTLHRALVEDVGNVPIDVLASHHAARLKSLFCPSVSPSAPEGVEGEEEEEEEEEEITHIAFHRSASVIALSTTFSRIHFFDLRNNVFLPHYLCAGNPNDHAVKITSMAFGCACTDSLVVGLDSGYVDIWNVDLSNSSASLYRAGVGVGNGHGFFSSPWDFQPTPTPFRGGCMFGKREFFTSRASPGTERLLAGVEVEGEAEVEVEVVRARMSRVGLVRQEFARQGEVAGAICAVAFSPGGANVVVGTSFGGVWVYSVTWGRASRVYRAPGTSVACISWDVCPDEDSPNEGDRKTVIVVGMGNGLVVYLPFADSCVCSEITSCPIEFYPWEKIPGSTRGAGIANVLLVPSHKPERVPGCATQNYPAFPTLIISLADTPGIHVFRLKRTSVLKSVTPPNSPSPSEHAPATVVAGGGEPFLRTLLEKAAQSSVYVLTGPPEADPYVPVHVTTLDTDVAVAEKIALDPTGKRLIATFTRGGGGEGSVVWFDTSCVHAASGGIGPLGVLRTGAREGSGNARKGKGKGKGRVYGDVGFVGNFVGGACAGFVEFGRVSLFPAWFRRGNVGGAG